MFCRRDRGRAEAKGIVCLRNGRAVRGAVCAAPHRGEGEESIGARATACGPASWADDSKRVSARRTAAGREPAGNLRPGWRTGRFPSGRPTVRGRDASRRFPLWRIPLWIAVGHDAGCRRGSTEAGTGDARRCVIIARSYVICGIRARSFAMNKLLSPHPSMPCIRLILTHRKGVCRNSNFDTRPSVVFSVCPVVRCFRRPGGKPSVVRFLSGGFSARNGDVISPATSSKGGCSA